MRSRAFPLVTSLGHPFTDVRNRNGLFLNALPVKTGNCESLLVHSVFRQSKHGQCRAELTACCSSKRSGCRCRDGSTSGSSSSRAYTIATPATPIASTANSIASCDVCSTTLTHWLIPSRAAVVPSIATPTRRATSRRGPSVDGSSARPAVMLLVCHERELPVFCPTHHCHLSPAQGTHAAMG